MTEKQLIQKYKEEARRLGGSISENQKRFMRVGFERS